MVEVQRLGMLTTAERRAGLGGCSKPESTANAGGEPGSVMSPASVSPSVPKRPYRLLAGSGKSVLHPLGFSSTAGHCS